MGVDRRIPSVYDTEKGCTYVYQNMPVPKREIESSEPEERLVLVITGRLQTRKKVWKKGKRGWLVYRTENGKL